MQVFNHHFSLSPTENPTLLCYSHFPCVVKSAEEMSVHSHAHTEIIYVLDGAGYFMQNENTVSLKKGDLVFINAYTPHGEYAPEVPLDYLVFSVDTFGYKEEPKTDASTQLQASTAQNPFERLYLYTLPDLLPWMNDEARAFEQEIRTTPPRFEAYLQSRFRCLLIKLLRRTALLPTAAPAELTKRTQLPLAVEQYLKDSFALEHSLDELAKHFFVSKNYLSTVFKNKFGVTPVQYLRNLRIDEAKYLLHDTNYSISEIASMTGFVNASHFARVYRECTGRTPTEEIELAYANTKK